MPLDPDAQAKISKFINEKWKSRNCHLCHANTWEVNGFVVLPVGDSPTQMVLGQRVLPTVAVVCRNCGNTHIVNAVVSGLVSADGVVLK